MRVKIQNIDPMFGFSFVNNIYEVVDGIVVDDMGYTVPLCVVEGNPDFYRIEYLEDKPAMTEKKNILMLDEDKVPSLVTKSELEQYLVDHVTEVGSKFTFTSEDIQFYLVTDNGLELLEPTNLEVVYKVEVKL